MGFHRHRRPDKPPRDLTVNAVPAIPTEGLNNKRALVSGGTRGIGAAIAARLKRAGANVTATGRRAPDHLAADHFIAANVAGSPSSPRSSGTKRWS
jgi:NADPH:quinone reductase-like Zn-dependent oxidoreductase